MKTTHDNPEVTPRNILVSINETLGTTNEHLAAIREQVVRGSTGEMETVSGNGQPRSADHVLLEFAKQLPRALCCLSGGAARLDCTIRETIRWYALAREEVRRAERNSKLDEDARTEAVASATLFLGKFEDDLTSLGVSFFDDFAAGTPLDPKAHRVEEEVSTDDQSLLGTVAECIGPLFTWKSLEGNECREFARVSVYRPLRKAKRSKRLG